MTASLNNRFPGAGPFDYTQEDIFKGREKDTQRLYRLVKLEQIVVLQGKSGIGKSSLINAGFLPIVDKDKVYEPIVIRFKDRNSDTENSELPLSPTEITGKAIRKDRAIQETFVDKIIENEKSLWHDVKELQVCNPDKRGFLLLFDQFEELFSYGEKEILEFKKNIAEALNVGVPQRYWDILDKSAQEGKDLLSNEELSLFHNKPNLTLVFIIRYDKLHLLNNLVDYLPNILKCCYELKPLTEAGAKDAITLPAAIEATDRFTSKPFQFTDSAIQKIINFLTLNHDDEIDTTHLQIICNKIEEQQIKNYEKVLDTNDLGELQKIIDNYYDDRIESIGDPKEQKSAKRLIEDKLVYVSDRTVRISLFEGIIIDFFQEKKIEHPKELLSKLVKSRLIRAESTEGGVYYELSHDRLIKTVVKEKMKYDIEQEELKSKELKNEIIKQRKRFARTAMLLAFSIAALLYAFHRNSIAAEALGSSEKSLKLEKEAKSNSILNIAQLNLDINPTLSFRLAEEAYNAQQSNPRAKKAILNAYNKSNTVQFYNSLQGHEKGKEINIIAFSPDDKLLLSASDDSNVIVWDKDGKVIKKFEKHLTAVTAACFSSTANEVASGSIDGTIMVWDIKKSSDPILYKCNSAVNSLCFSPNQNSVFAALDNHELIEWNFQTNEVKTLHKHRGEVLFVGCNNEGNYLFSHSSDHKVQKINISGDSITSAVPFDNDGKTESFGFYPMNNFFYIIRNNSKQIRIYNIGAIDPAQYKYLINSEIKIASAAISTDAQFLVYSTSDNDIVIKNFNNKKEKTIDRVHTGKIYKILFSPNNQYFATVSDDQSVKIWTSTGDLLQEIKGHKSFRTQITFSSDGSVLVTTVNEELRTWQFKRDKIMVVRAHSGLSVNDIVILEDGKHFLSGGNDNMVKLWAFNNETSPVYQYQHPEMKAIGKLSLSSTDNKRYIEVFAATSENLVFTWDIENTYEPRKIMSEHEDDITAVDFSTDGSYLISSDKDGIIYEWPNTDNDHTMRRLKLNPAFQILDNNYFGEDSEYIITTPKSKELNHAIFILNKADSNDMANFKDKSIKTLSGHKDEVNIIELSNNQKFLASGSEDKSIIIWNSEGEQQAKLIGHTDGILDLDFSYDNKFLVSTSKDMTVRIWDLKSFELLLTISEHNQTINTVSFSKNTDYILSGSSDGTIRIKPIELNVDTIFKKVNIEKKFGEVRKLSSKEKEEYGIE